MLWNRAKDYYTKQTRIQLFDQEDIISDIARLQDRMSEEDPNSVVHM